MVDIHTHILPGFDDGARDWALALDMARWAAEDGIETMVATPHFMGGVYEPTKRQVLDAVELLNAFLREKGISIHILPGMEYSPDEKFDGMLVDGDLLTINQAGRYILLEFPTSMLSKHFMQIFYKLQLAGMTAIIAHPERSQILNRNMENIWALYERGAVFQITAGSLLGHFGGQARMNAWMMLEQGLVHIVSSDAHSRHRKPVLSKARQAIEKKYGLDTAVLLTSNNPRKVISGQPVEECGPQKPASFWQSITGYRARISTK